MCLLEMSKVYDLVGQPSYIDVMTFMWSVVNFIA